MPAPRPSARLTFGAFALAAGLAALGCLNQAEEHRVRANAFLRGNDAAAALGEGDKGLALRRDDQALIILRGKALFELDRFDEARASYQRAVELGKAGDPRSVSEAHLGLAMIAARRQEWQAAKASFLELVKVNDRDAAS